MSAEGPVASRSMLLALALTAGVLACGAGGLLLGRHRFHANDPDRVASAATGQAVPAIPVAAAPGTAATEPRGFAHPDAGGPPSASSPLVAASADITSSISELSREAADAGEVQRVIERWRSALLTNHAAEIAPLYAARVNRYFRQTHVSRAYVQDSMERQEEGGIRLTAYDLRDVAVKQLKGDEVEVDFHAAYKVSTPTLDRAGDTRTVLMLRRENGSWKIVYERDFRG